jgi:predicted ferric reductase
MILNMSKNIQGFLTALGLVVFLSLIFVLYQILNYPRLDSIVLLARVSGMVGFLIFSASVIYGLYQSNKLFLKFKYLDAPLALSTHRYFSWFGLFLAIIHRQATEFFASSLDFVPVVSNMKAFLMFLGNLGLVIFLIVIISSELRGKYVPIPIWRSLHYLSFIGYFLILAHAFLIGSNTTEPFYLFWYVGTFLVICFLTILRIYASISSRVVRVGTD